MIYVIGSLSNPRVEEVADKLRDDGWDVFDQWRAAHGDYWADYAKRRGMKFRDALEMDFTQTAFDFDMKYLSQAEIGVLVMPAGRSAGLELGWLLGRGKRGYILYDGEPERPDLMSKLATDVCFSMEELLNALNTSDHQFHQVGHPNPRLHPAIPRLGISCACADCERGRRDRGGDRLLTPEMIGAIS